MVLHILTPLRHSAKWTLQMHGLDTFRASCRNIYPLFAMVDDGITGMSSIAFACIHTAAEIL